MATRVILSNTLVGQSAIQYIRAQTLTLHLAEARPSTKMYVFFDGVDVTSLCRNIILNAQGKPVSISTAEDVMTNEAGEATIAFRLPANTFNTGTRQIIVTDTDELGNLEINGSVWGSAKTQFKANGILEIFQPKITEINSRTVYIPPPPPPPRRQDPLAQSFFTYGVPGGIFLSSIDLFFHTKDNKLPVTVEIRPMVNGYPAPLPANNPSLVSTVNAADVAVSSDASAPTKFKFEPPIYLKDESDYCFVVTSNSKAYNIYTARMGERAYETGLKIFNQPYVGSIFKSENNVTWTAEQFDDIKFTINKCQFDTTVETILDFATVVPPVAAFGEQFTTTAGSRTVRYRHSHEHGLEVNSVLKIYTKTEDLYANANFNGIPYSEFNREHVVTAVIDRNTVEFQVPTTPATSTGTIDSANIITGFDVVSGGTQYTSSATVQFIGTPTGDGATEAVATPVIVNGVLKSINLTNAGIGYKKAPAVNILRNGGPAGTGAVVTATVQAAFSVVTNKPMTGFKPNIVVSNYGNTSTENTIYTTLGNYTGGSLQTYADGKFFEFTPMFPYANIGQNSLVASTFNETAKRSGNISTKLRMKLNTTNPNLSPVVNLNIRPTLNAYYTRINNQPGETITSTNSSGGLVAAVYAYDANAIAANGTIKITNPGTGYDVPPIITISAPDYPEGVQATATCTISSGAINSVTITNGGSGYTSAPIITVTKAGSTGSGGAIQASLTPFNTELRAKGGKAKARYITKKTNLKVTSSGIRLIATISSVQGASVDWYVRTSVSGSGVHEEQPWRRLTCDSARNKSSYIGEMFDYEFKLDNIPPFNTYDLKCVMLAQDPTKAPIVDGYRVIVVV